MSRSDELLHVPSWAAINGAIVQVAQMMERRAKFDALRDAADECEHGRLPGDRLDGGAPNWPHTHPCGCWPGEDPTPDLIGTLEASTPDPPRRRPARKPQKPTTSPRSS